MYGFEDEFEFYVQEFSVEDTREELGKVVKYFQEQPYHEHAMKLFIQDYRQLPLQVAYDADAFCVDEEIEISEFPEWMQVESLGFIKGQWCPMWGRCVFPVKDVKGQVMGFCGWDPFVDPKYLDSKNYGYKAKLTTLYGMEKLPEYYASGKPVYVTEGLMCCLYLRSKGFQALATLGSHLTAYVITILARFGNRLVMIPDNDETGDKYVHQVKYRLPKAICVQVAYGKDIEGCRKLEEHKYEEQLLRELQMLSNPFARTYLLIRR